VTNNVPALEIPAQIRVPAIQTNHTRHFPRSTLANARVLELLFPQLVTQQTKPAKQRKVLAYVDHYMLQETREVYARIEGFCRRLNIKAPLQIRLNATGGYLEVFGDPDHCQSLSVFINDDSWLKGALGWLQPNYLMLAQSVEIMSFAQAYEHSPSLALQQYGHLDQTNNNMELYLKCGNCPVELLTESPLHIYAISSL
jgi:hypothetical protein